MLRNIERVLAFIPFEFHTYYYTYIYIDDKRSICSILVFLKKLTHLLNVASNVVVLAYFVWEKLEQIPSPQPCNYQQIRGRHYVAFSLRFDHFYLQKGWFSLIPLSPSHTRVWYH